MFYKRTRTQIRKLIELRPKFEAPVTYYRINDNFYDGHNLIVCVKYGTVTEEYMLVTADGHPRVFKRAETSDKVISDFLSIDPNWCDDDSIPY